MSNPAVGRIMTITFTSGMIELSVGSGGGSLLVVTRNGGGAMLSSESVSLTSTGTWIDVVRNSVNQLLHY